jgi:hypothetical protein
MVRLALWMEEKGRRNPNSTNRLHKSLSNNRYVVSRAQAANETKYVLLLPVRSYTRTIRQLVDIGAFAEKEVIQ